MSLDRQNRRRARLRLRRARGASRTPSSKRRRPRSAARSRRRAEIRLKFSEGVEPHFSGVALTAEGGAAVPLGKPSVDPADNSVLIVKVGKTLPPGVYTVNWHAVSVDTHHTQGDFQFTVKP